jgi:hypothetical protein
MTTTKFRFSLFASLALTTAACGVEPDLGPSTPETMFYVKAKDQVEGSFGQDGVSVDFHLQKLSTQKLHIVIRTREGFALVDSVIDNNVARTTVLETHTLSSVDTVSDGIRRDALADLAAMPETQLLPELTKELADAGIDPALLDGMATVTNGVVYCPTVPVDPRRPTALGVANERF